MPSPLPNPCALVPADRYTSPEWVALEASALWPRVWLFACFGSDIAQMGERQVLDIGTESALVLRGDDGQVRAFHNVCRHRGMRLCESGAPSSRDQAPRPIVGAAGA